MKILIVDDEMMTKEWLKLTIASLPFTITQLETASNGEEALSKIADNHFDLIFIDVMMPKMNGLELLKRINELGSEAMLVVLSSHDEFKFAKEAIKYNVTEYVLKNECSREKLTELLHACEESIDNKKSVGNLHEELMHKVIHNNIQNSSIQFIERLFIQAEGEVMCVVVIRGGAEFLPPVYEKQKVVITCQGLIGRTELHAFYLLTVSGSNEELSFSHAKQFYAQYVCEKTGEKISMGRSFEKLDEILPECRNAWIGYQKLFYLPKLYTIGPNMFKELDAKAVDSLCDKTLSDIRAYAEETTLENLQEIGSFFKHEQPTDIDAVLQIYIALLSTFIIYNNKRSRNLTEKLEAFRSKIHTFTHFDDLSAWILETVENNAELMVRNRFSPSVEKAIKFIEDHYQEILSVSEIADHVNLSLDYFSRYFKKEVGENLNSYLINFRLDKASIILLSSNLSVQEVAKKVGIDNGSYFSKCFKKKFHTPPVRFRIQPRE